MIYIASPYSHPDAAICEHRYHAVSKYNARLLREGLPAYSPITHCHCIARDFHLPTDAKFWREFNFHMIRCSHALHVAQLPGWDESIGVAGEIEFAQSLRVPIFYITENEVLK